MFCHLHEAESQVNAAVRWAMYLPLQFCTGVVANSAYTRKVLADSSVGLVGRTAIVHNTVPGPASVTPPRNELDGDVRLLYVGRLSHRKGIQVAVSAMDLLRRRGIDTRLDIVGAVFPGNEQYERDLRALIGAHELSDSVQFHGFQSQVWPFLEQTDIAVVPATEDESFGNTAAEASLAARPAVVSAIAGLREATSASESVTLVTPGDATELADAVQGMISDWTNVSRLARGDADRVAARFSADAYRRQLVDALGLTG